MIELSRDFVCVRLNAWLDDVNVERAIRLQGHHQNSALALLAPDSPRLSMDDFPAREDCAWGPMSFAGSGPGKPAWSETMRRSRELGPAMDQLRRAYPARTAAAAPAPASDAIAGTGAAVESSAPRLPVHPDLGQTLNLAACDSRAVVALVDAPSDNATHETSELETRLARLAHDPALAGRAHHVRLELEAWTQAVEAGVLEGADLAATGTTQPLPFVAVIRPEPYGRSGVVLARIAEPVPEPRLRRELAAALIAFHHEFEKQDRSAHIVAGRRDGIRWDEVQAKDWKTKEERSEN